LRRTTTKGGINAAQARSSRNPARIIWRMVTRPLAKTRALGAVPAGGWGTSNRSQVAVADWGRTRRCDVVVLRPDCRQVVDADVIGDRWGGQHSTLFKRLLRTRTDRCGRRTKSRNRRQLSKEAGCTLTVSMPVFCNNSSWRAKEIDDRLRHFGSFRLLPAALRTDRT
jgi:hypothetical protein